jgi:hypothetical protein
VILQATNVVCPEWLYVKANLERELVEYLMTHI